MSDKILIRKLETQAIIGIHDWEKQKKQTILVDMDLWFDCLPAAHSDDIKDALDYFTVCESVTNFIEQSKYELIETLAEKISQLVLRDFPCNKIKLSLYKPEAVANTQTVGITIKRTRQG